MFKGLFDKLVARTKVASAVHVTPETVLGTQELDFLLIKPSPDVILNALEGWSWLLPDGLKVVAVTAFGDIFFSSADGSIHFLDTLEGVLKPAAVDLASLTDYLRTEEGRDHFLLEGLIVSARLRGVVPAAGECYDFHVAPAIGGPISVEAMHTMSFLVKVHVAGQLHRQIHDLPPGTPITGFEYRP